MYGGLRAPFLILGKANMKVANQEPIGTPVIASKPDPKKDMKTYLKYMRDKDRQQVRGVFRFYEVPGGFMSFVFRAYIEDDVERYDMYDGEVYSVPFGVAKHLNKNGWYPEHSFVMNEKGENIAQIGKKVRRFGFQSLEFMDESEFDEPADIVTVTKI